MRVALGLRLEGGSDTVGSELEDSVHVGAMPLGRLGDGSRGSRGVMRLRLGDGLKTRGLPLAPPPPPPAPAAEPEGSEEESVIRGRRPKRVGVVG